MGKLTNLSMDNNIEEREQWLGVKRFRKLIRIPKSSAKYQDLMGIQEITRRSRILCHSNPLGSSSTASSSLTHLYQVDSLFVVVVSGGSGGGGDDHGLQE